MALFLSKFNYTIGRVRVEGNVFADTLARWTRGYWRMKGEMLFSVLLHQSEQIVPTSNSLTWHSIAVFRNSQRDAAIPSTAEKDLYLDDDDMV